MIFAIPPQVCLLWPYTLLNFYHDYLLQYNFIMSNKKQASYIYIYLIYLQISQKNHPYCQSHSNPNKFTWTKFYKHSFHMIPILVTKHTAIKFWCFIPHISQTLYHPKFALFGPYSEKRNKIHEHSFQVFLMAHKITWNYFVYRKSQL